VLPIPADNPVENDLSRNALPYAAALAGACPQVAPAANVLPAEYRRSNSRAVFIPSAILGVLVLMVAGGSLAYSSWSEKQYLASLNREIAALEPTRKRAELLDKQAAQLRARALLLEEFRKQTRKDLDAFNEMTRLIEPPAWTKALEITRENVRLDGDAPAASAVIQLLDGSPLFERSEPLSLTRGPNGEGFTIRSFRRAGK
jgi:Tfp pilus assembly protein PilN